MCCYGHVRHMDRKVAEEEPMAEEEQIQTVYRQFKAFDLTA